MTWNPLIVSIVVLVVWTIITLGGEIWQAGSREALQKLVSDSLVYCLVAAALFLLAVVAYLGWWRQVGLLPGDTASNFKMLILPALGVVAIWVVAFSRGLKTASFGVLGINTLLVGFSEELMFRGVLFHGVQAELGSIRAVVITALLFGSVHALNGFITGDRTRAVEQAGMTVLFGFWIGAVRLYMSTLYPLMIIHWLWDLGLFVAAPAEKPPPAEMARAGKALLIPPGVAIVLFVYGLYLLYAHSGRH